MVPDIAKDRLITHAVTNYLLAGFQGRFTFLNILAQLGYPNLNVDTLTATREALDKVAFWTQELWNDRFLFSAKWTSPQTFDARHALELLDLLKPDLYGVAAELVRILSAERPTEKLQDVAFLCAAFGRFAYARENYIKGFIDFGSKFGDTQEASRYAALLPPAQDDVRLTHTILNLVRDPNSASSIEFTRGIIERSVPLIAVFRTHAHDVNQLLAQFRGGLSFDKADFTIQEATAWTEAGLGPVAAGYWRASGFAPPDAQEWMRYGFSSPSNAALWRSFSFDPPNAQPWAQANFAPAYARGWLQNGYSPEESLLLIQKGINDPIRAGPKPKATE